MGRIFGKAFNAFACIAFVIITGSVTTIVALAADPPTPDPMSDDYFVRIGATPGMSFEELRKAFRKALFLYHEDRGGDAQSTRNIIEAWEVLRDTQSRFEYMEFRRLDLRVDTNPFYQEMRRRSVESLESEFIEMFLQSSSLEYEQIRELEWAAEHAQDPDTKILARIVLSYPPSISRGSILSSIEKAFEKYDDYQDRESLEKIYQRVYPSKSDVALLLEVAVIRDYRPDLAFVADALIELIRINPLPPRSNGWCARALRSFKDAVGL